MVSNKFWHTKQPNEYTVEEWESVCTRCGKCCLVKLQDEDSDDIFYTDVICRYHDPKTNNCTQYSKRCELVPSCLKLNPQNIGNIPWIPETCAYIYWQKQVLCRLGIRLLPANLCLKNLWFPPIL